MTHPIDVLVIEPSEADARKTVAAIRRKAPGLSTVHVSGAQMAAELIFDYWPSDHPQVPRLVIVDLDATGEPGKDVLSRLRSAAATRNVATVLKPIGGDEYAVEVDRAVGQLLLEQT